MKRTKTEARLDDEDAVEFNNQLLKEKYRHSSDCGEERDEADAWGWGGGRGGVESQMSRGGVQD